MTTFTEGRHTAEFIISEASGNRSRQNGTLASGQNLTAGTVLQINSDNKLVAWDGTRDSGAGLDPQAEGILLADSDASGGDLAVAYIDGEAEVNINLITYPSTDRAEVIASLLLKDIKVR